MDYWLEEKDLHWSYFLALEEDLETLSRFVEITEANFACYSTECTRLLLASCSEIEVVLKLATNLSDRKNLKHCLKPLGTDADLLRSSVITVRRSGLKIQPWKDWAPETPPAWWESHNAVKHNRSKMFGQANLQNCLYAICALLSATLIYLRRRGVNGVSPAPRLLRVSQEIGSHDMTSEGAMIHLQEPVDAATLLGSIDEVQSQK